VSIIDSQTDIAARRQTAPATGDSPAEARSFEPSRFDNFARAPTASLPLPGRGRITLATDRVRAKPALSPQLSFALGQNAVGLGIWGLLFPKSVNRLLGMNAHPTLVQAAFGAREMYTGVTLASDPTRADALWMRVAGDVFDIAVLKKLDRPDNPKRGAARLALGVVLAVTALDVVAAVRMTNVNRTCA
jgi:hypothetical protein